MEHSDHWEQLQRHGSLHDTYLSEDPPHIRKMYLISCLRSLLFADTIAAKELQEEEDQQKRKQQEKEEAQKRKDEAEEHFVEKTESSSANNINNDDDDQQNNENNNNTRSSQQQVITAIKQRQNSSSTSNNNSFTPAAAATTTTTSTTTNNHQQSFHDQMNNTTDGIGSFFWSIAAMLRRCETPDCETGEAKNALRVLGPHNVVLTWISRPRLSGGTISAIGPAQTTDDWNMSVMCDGCIQKSLAKMANVGPPVKPETAESLTLERRRSAFLLVDVTSWPSWAGSVQYAPWLNIRWGVGQNSAKTQGNGSQAGNSTINNIMGTPSETSSTNSNNNNSNSIFSLATANTASIEHSFITSIKSAFEAGQAQGLFLLPGNRESITMNLENLIFFGYGCAHSDEPDIIRTALRNPSIYPVLFHKILSSLRGLELWRNRSQTPAQIEAALKLRKEQEKRRKKLAEEQKKKKEKEEKDRREREKKGLPPVAVVSTTAGASSSSQQQQEQASEMTRRNSTSSNSFVGSGDGTTNNNNNSNSNSYFVVSSSGNETGKPLEWIDALERNLIPLRHPTLCHFSTHCESLQPTKKGNNNNNNLDNSDDNNKNSTTVITIDPKNDDGSNNNSNNNNSNTRGDNDGEDHGVSFSLLVDTEEKRFIKYLDKLEEEQKQSASPFASPTKKPKNAGGLNGNLFITSPNNSSNNSPTKKAKRLLKHPRSFGTSAAFISLHLFVGGDVSIDAISAWHLIPPKHQVSDIVLELNRNDSDTGVVPRMLQSMQHQLVGLHLTDCQFSTWTDFFTDVLVVLPHLQSLKMICCRCGLEDAVQDSNATPSVLNYYSSNNNINNNNSHNLGSTPRNGNNNSGNLSSGGAAAAAAAVKLVNHHRRTSSLLPPSNLHHPHHTRQSSALLRYSMATNNNNNNAGQQHSRTQSLSNSGNLFLSNNSNNNNNASSSSPSPASNQNTGGGGGGPLQKFSGTLKQLKNVELRSVAVDSKVISRFFDLAPNISSFVFPQNAIRRQQMQQNGFSIDPQQINLLTERMFLQLMNNATKLKSLEILAECPGELFALNFWSPSSGSSSSGHQRQQSTGGIISPAARQDNSNNSNSFNRPPNQALSALSHSVSPGVSNNNQMDNNNNSYSPSGGASSSIGNYQLQMQQKHNFTLDFWSRFNSLKAIHCQGWLSRSMLHAVAHLQNVEFIDGASSLDLTRADLFEACLIPAFRREGRLFPSLRYLDVSFCHRLLSAGRTLNDPIDENAEKIADERIATIIRQTFPDRSVARRILLQQKQKQKLMSAPITGGSSLMDPKEIDELYGESNIIQNNDSNNNTNNRNKKSSTANTGGVTKQQKTRKLDPKQFDTKNYHHLPLRHDENSSLNEDNDEEQSTHDDDSGNNNNHNDNTGPALTDENLGDTTTNHNNINNSLLPEDEMEDDEIAHPPSVHSSEEDRSSENDHDNDDQLGDTMDPRHAIDKNRYSSGDMASDNNFNNNNINQDDDDIGVVFDPYPNAPALRVLCQRGFRNVPRSLLNLEVELLTSCRNEEEDGHKVDVIDMRAIKMTDEERELVTYQFESCDVNYLLADTPILESADVMTPSSNSRQASTNMFLNNNIGGTPQQQSRSSMVTPRIKGITPRASATTGVSALSSKTPRNDSTSVFARNSNNNNNNSSSNSDNQDEKDQDGNSKKNSPSTVADSSNNNNNKDGKEEKKCIIQ